MGISVLVVLFAVLSAVFADVLVDQMNPSVHMSVRGYDNTTLSASTDFMGVQVATQLATVSFTVPSSAPSQFTFKLLARNYCKSSGSLAPVGERYGKPVDMFDCTSNGVSVSFKAADENPTYISLVEGMPPVPTYGNNVTVMKNDVTEDTTVTCSYYTYNGGSSCNYNSATVFIQYTYEEEGSPVTEHAEAKFTSYSEIAMNMYTGTDSDLPINTVIFNFYSDGVGVKNGDQFTAVFDGPVTFAAPCLRADGKVHMIDYEDFLTSKGSCDITVSGDVTTLSCTWTSIGETVNDEFDVFFILKTPVYTPKGPLGVVFNNIGGIDIPVYAMVANPGPTPVFDAMIHGTRAVTPVKFFVPMQETVGDAVAVTVEDYQFTMIFSQHTVTTRVFSPTCTKSGKVFANLEFAKIVDDVGFTRYFYNVSFTEDGLAAMDESNAIDCVLTVDLKSTFVNQAQIYITSPLYDDSVIVDLPVYNGPIISAMPMGPHHDNNYLMIEAAKPFTALDRASSITVVGVSFSEGLSMITCKGTTSGSKIVPATYTDASKTFVFTVPYAVTSCYVPVPSDSVIGSSISVTSDGVLTDVKQYVVTAPEDNTFVNNFIEGVKSTSFITFKNLPVRMMAAGDDVVTMDAATKDRVTIDTFICSTVDAFTETTLYIKCLRSADSYNCGFATNFATAATYADVTCAFTAVIADSTDDVIISVTNFTTVNLGPAAASSELAPAATFDVVSNTGKVNNAYPTHVPAGAAATAYINLYNVVLVEGDMVTFSFYSEENMDYAEMFKEAAAATLAGCTSTFNDTHLTFTKDSSASTGPYTGTASLVVQAIEGYKAQVVITNANDDGNALKTVDVSRINVPDFYTVVDKFAPVEGPAPNTIAMSIATNTPQYIEMYVYPGSIDGEDIITDVSYLGNSNCGSITKGGDGIYRTSSDATDLPAGTVLECTIVFTYEKNFACTDDCSNAPKFAMYRSVPDEVSTLAPLLFGDSTVKIARTHGAFSSETAGFAVYADFFAGGSIVTVDNDFGLTSAVNVYLIGETEVGDTPVGTATPTGTGNLTVSIDSPVLRGDSLFGFPGYVAVPVFMSSNVLPTIKDLDITATVNGVTSASLTVGNGDAVMELTPAEITTPIRQNTEFFVNFTLTSTHLDELTAKIDFSATGATFVACENDVTDTIPLPYVAAAMKLTDVVPEAEAEDGILTVPVPKTDATIENSLAKYSYMCSFTAGAYVKGKTAATVPIDVMFGTTIVKTADLAVPAPSRLPVTGTKLSVDIVRDTLFTSTELTALLNALVKVMQNLDPTFNIARLFQISQKLNVFEPKSIHVTAGSTVTLSTSFTGVTVTDTAALAADTESSVEALGYEADTEIEGADIEVNCTEGCGSEECGLCLDGNACTDAAQCFSGKCGDGVCGGGNSAASVSVALCAALAAIASLMLF